MNINFLDIEWAPGYRVGDNGTVWSRRTSSMLGKMSDTWKQLKPKRYPAGYLCVGLIVNGKRHHRFVHRLVLETFVGPCPFGMQCRHFDGNPSNNFLSNLKWDTAKNNVSDKILHGTQPRGSVVKNSVTNESQVRIIKRLLKVGLRQTIIAYAFGLNVSVVNNISSGKYWNHVTLEDES